VVAEEPEEGQPGFAFPAWSSSGAAGGAGGEGGSSRGWRTPGVTPDRAFRG
jgi:hypothetical protein